MIHVFFADSAIISGHVIMTNTISSAVSANKNSIYGSYRDGHVIDDSP